MGENFTRAPEVAVIREGQYCALRTLDLGYAEYAEAIARVDHVTWEAADGLEISGWLLLPKGKPPYPLILAIHGGPVWHWRPVWLGRRAGAPYLMLVRRGYALFFPNPAAASDGVRTSFAVSTGMGWGRCSRSSRRPRRANRAQNRGHKTSWRHWHELRRVYDIMVDYAGSTVRRSGQRLAPYLTVQVS